MADSGAIYRGGLRGLARKPERSPRPRRQVERGRRVIPPAVDRIGRIAGVEKFILGKSVLEEKSALSIQEAIFILPIKNSEIFSVVLRRILSRGSWGRSFKRILA